MDQQLIDLLVEKFAAAIEGVTAADGVLRQAEVIAALTQTIATTILMIPDLPRGAREQEMTYAQAAAFVRKALEIGKAALIPCDRAKSMAIGIAAQFDLLLRQKDIIGEWVPSRPEITGAAYDGAGKMWLGRFRWDNVGQRARLEAASEDIKDPRYSNDNSPSKPPILRFAWDVYRVAARARWVGQVVAGNANEAIEAAVEFQTDIKKLIAVRRWEIA